MKPAVLAAISLLAAAGATAADHRHISPRELVAAIKRADISQLDVIAAAKVTTSSVRVIRCAGPDEEPTEFECVWQIRGKRGWITHKSWLAVDGEGWHFIG